MPPELAAAGTPEPAAPDGRTRRVAITTAAPNICRVRRKRALGDNGDLERRPCGNSGEESLMRRSVVAAEEAASGKTAEESRRWYPRSETAEQTHLTVRKKSRDKAS